jgi:ribosomal-protein-alanine N-acetyltransferase
MIAVRDGRPEDRGPLRAIQTLALPEPSPDLLAAALESGPPVVQVAVDRGDAAPAAAAGDGQPVGYALVVPGEVAYLAELAVAPARQGEGIGSDLLETVCREADRVRVTARADDDRVRAFYEARGFEPVEVLPGFFESGDGVALAR